MRYKFLIVTITMLVIAGSANAQDKLGYGFRAGASISTFNGPSEIGPNGESLESWSNAKGFHIGALIHYRFTDLFGARAEFTFSQRGTIYDYKGPSYYELGRYTVANKLITGTRNQKLNVSNAYVDIPLMVYYKFGMFEISGGLNSAILIASTAGGSTDFDGVSDIGSPVAPFEVALNHNYKKDKAQGASETTIDVNVQGFPYKTPETVYAYYEFLEKDKNLYKTLDFGLVAAGSIYLNEGLFFSVRYIHGLGDVDENEYDVSLQTLNQDGSFVQRADENKSRSWQFSVGFSF